jgi:hypothetical protein
VWIGEQVRGSDGLVVARQPVDEVDAEAVVGVPPDVLQTLDDSVELRSRGRLVDGLVAVGDGRLDRGAERAKAEAERDLHRVGAEGVDELEQLAVGIRAGNHEASRAERPLIEREPPEERAAQVEVRIIAPVGRRDDAIDDDACARPGGVRPVVGCTTSEELV